MMESEAKGPGLTVTAGSCDMETTEERRTEENPTGQPAVFDRDQEEN